MQEYHVLVVEWTKILPTSPGMLNSDEILNIVVNNNTPQIIPPEFYNEELFLNYYTSLGSLKDFSYGFKIQKLKTIGNYHFLVFNTLEELEFYQLQKQTSPEWAQYVVHRDKLIKLLGVECISHSIKYKITVENQNFDTALTELENNIRASLI